MKRKAFIVILVISIMLCLVACDTTKENTDKAGNMSPTGSTVQGTKDPVSVLGDVTNDGIEPLPIAQDIDSFQIQIQDQVFSLPVKYGEFVSHGWHIDEKYEDINGKVKSGARELVWFANGSYRINCYLYNPDISEQPYEKCVISGFQIDTRFESKGLTVYLPGKIRLGEATKNLITSQYRDADKKQDSSSSSKYTWNTDNNWSSVAITFDEEGKAVGYSGENPVAPDDFINSDPVIGDVEYTAPDKLSINVEDRIVSFGGDLYCLPAPLSAFIANGWTTTQANDPVEGNGVAHISLTRDDKEIRLSVWNHSQTACTANTAFVEKLSSTDFYGSIFAVAEGLSTNISESTFINYAQEHSIEYEKSDGVSGSKYIVRLQGDELTNYCIFAFDGEQINYITISSSKK